MLFICFSTTCQVLVQVNIYESHSEMSGKTWLVINTIQEYGMPEKDFAVLCLFLIQKNYSVFISQAGLLTITVSYTDVSWCGFASKIGVIWTIFCSDQRITQGAELLGYLCGTNKLIQGHTSTSKQKWKNAVSAPYCFLNCSTLGNTLFSSRIHLNCVITTIPHLKMVRHPPKLYCCSKTKGRKGQAYSSNSTTIFKVFSCLTINVTPETNNEHSD